MGGVAVESISVVLIAVGMIATMAIAGGITAFVSRRSKREGVRAIAMPLTAAATGIAAFAFAIAGCAYASNVNSGNISKVAQSYGVSDVSTDVNPLPIDSPKTVNYKASFRNAKGAPVKGYISVKNGRAKLYVGTPATAVGAQNGGSEATVHAVEYHASAASLTTK